MSSKKVEVPDEGKRLSRQEIDKCVREAVKAILVLDYTKKPFKQADIGQYLSYKPNRKTWNEVLDKTKVKLEEIGLKLVDVKISGTKSFFLVTSEEQLSCMYRVAPEEEVADRVLLTLVLTYIFMKDGRVSHDELLLHLKHLGVYNESRPVHKYFGDVKKKVLFDYVSQLYLEKTVRDKESDVFEMEWGERANAEVNKMGILKFVCDIGYEKTITPKTLGSHYQKALEDGWEGGIDDNELENVEQMKCID